MAQRQLFIQEGESLEEAKRRDNSEAPFGRCGDHAKPGEFQGCGEPMIDTDWHVCSTFPDCCRP